MSYYYINTDTDALGYSPHAKWIEYNHAFTSGNSQKGYEDYGVRVLGKLSRGDILFMYANKCGVMAAGRVSESWNRRSYEGGDRLIYQECAEYRIGVDWYLDVVNNPINTKDLKSIGLRTPIPTLQPIKDNNAAERLLEEIQNRVSGG
jgi:hypothetical protein